MQVFQLFPNRSGRQSLLGMVGAPQRSHWSSSKISRNIFTLGSSSLASLLYELSGDHLPGSANRVPSRPPSPIRYHAACHRHRNCQSTHVSPPQEEYPNLKYTCNKMAQCQVQLQEVRGLNGGSGCTYTGCAHCERDGGSKGEGARLRTARDRQTVRLRQQEV